MEFIRKRSMPDAAKTEMKKKLAHFAPGEELVQATQTFPFNWRRSVSSWYQHFLLPLLRVLRNAWLTSSCFGQVLLRGVGQGCSFGYGAMRAHA